MNPRELLDALPFAKFSRALKQCPFCGKDMSNPEGMFRDKLSFKEFCISGLCQECQDKVFEK